MATAKRAHLHESAGIEGEHHIRARLPPRQGAAADSQVAGDMVICSAILYEQRGGHRQHVAGWPVRVCVRM
jgi:hypothetical protein